jgi:hypothetical protein
LDTEGSKVLKKLETSVDDVSSEERRYFTDSTKERYVMFFGVIGPFERSFPDAPESDQRRELRRVEATVRLYSVEGGCTYWKPHFIKIEVRKGFNRIVDMLEIFYVDGRVEGRPQEANAENPCEIMCVSQVPANYPQFHQLTREPGQQVARSDW